MTTNRELGSSNRFVPWKRLCILLTFYLATETASPAQTFKTLVRFNDYSNGAGPSAPLIQANDGNLYGTTASGGLTGGGTVFKMTLAGKLTPLYSFCAETNCADGEYPWGLVQGRDGNFYGTTFYGGGGSGNNCKSLGGPCGTVFRITLAGVLTKLYDFCSQANCSDGYFPYAGLTQGTDGNFYGTTSLGGVGVTHCLSGLGCGTVFKITPGGTLTTLYSFCSQPNCSDGVSPFAGLIQGRDGNFYGTTFGGDNSGGISYGTVFKITPAGILTTLHSFCAQSNCPDGSYPSAGLIQGTDGNFYGTTEYGGNVNGGGTVFRITPAGVLTTLYSFCSQANCSDGLGPTAGLIQGTDGNFYGTTTFAGNAEVGNLFRTTQAGVLTTLYAFCSQPNCTDGVLPYAGLIQATDGNLYGTTTGGGDENGDGTVFTLALQTALKLSPTKVTFATELIGTTSPLQSVKLTNSTDSTVNVVAIVANGDFSQNNTCGQSLGPNASCEIDVVFTPTAKGTRTGTVTVTYEGAGNPQMAVLTGTGTMVELSPASVSFGNWPVGTTSTPQTVALANKGSTTLSIAGINITGSNAGDFAISMNTCGNSLSAGNSCTITVTFTPTAAGSRKAAISVSDNGGGSPQSVSLTGTGT